MAEVLAGGKEDLELFSEEQRDLRFTQKVA